MNRTEEIAEGIYWVGGSEHEGGLHCNPYLIVDGEEAVLIDPGSVLDFDYVYQNVCNIVPLSKIKYVILHHQDPDFCASVPLFEAKGAEFTIVTHWRTQTLVKYYGVKSDYYIVNENQFQLTLNSGRVISFVPTPYLHFPGAIVSYDNKTKTLFSSDIFGAFSYEWSLYAGDDYMERMKTFHEHYMPSNDILRPVMELLLTMEIDRIAPQHGSVINSKVKDYIKALRDLECGAFLMPIKKDLVKAGGYRSVCSTVLKRYATVFHRNEVLEAVEGLDITMDQDTFEISDYNYKGIDIWNLLFQHILAKKGLQWLLIIEPLVQRLSKEYDIPVPEVFQTEIKRTMDEAAALNKENALLREMNLRLAGSLKEAQEKMIRCPVTGLYNNEFFQNYLAYSLKELVDGQNPALVIISVDNMSKIKFSYGNEEVDTVLRNIVYLMNGLKEEDMILFRLQGASFACFSPHTNKEQVIAFADNIRNLISGSDKFIERITVSVGVLCYDEIGDMQMMDPAEVMVNTAMMRVKLAKNMGMNIVCGNSSIENYQEEVSKVLIADTDLANIDVIKTFLENLNYKVYVANDGEEALESCEKEAPDLVISEIMLPKFDGFQLREKLLSQSQTKNIPFIIVSHLKNDDSVKHAAALEIEHYFKKPYMLSELLGVIRNKVKGDAYL